MNFAIENVGKVNKASITLDGITVIAGYNNTGKSTILKSVYAMLKTYFKLDVNITTERIKSMEAIISNQMMSNIQFSLPKYRFISSLSNSLIQRLMSDNLVMKDVVNFNNAINDVVLKIKSDFDEIEDFDFVYAGDNIKTLYDKLERIYKRYDSVYEAFAAELNLKKVFDAQAGSYMNEQKSIIQLQDQTMECEVEFINNEVLTARGVNLGNRSVVYIETMNILDVLNDKEDVRNSVDARGLIRKADHMVNEGQPSIEEYEEMKANTSELAGILEEVLHGNLTKDPDKVQYKDKYIDQPINMRNVASGMKIFLTIQRLVENGTLTRGSVLLIDEPETNLHPEWHLKFAEILVLMKKRMGIDVLVTSHSPYFMRALEVKLADYEMKKSGNYYLMKVMNQMYDAEDVTLCTDKIYEQLYRPLDLL